MNMIGLIGGMSWESTLLYYRIINTEVANAQGKLHSAPLLIYSFDFEEIAALQKAQRWDEAAHKLAQAGLALKAAGATALVICTNTMHMVVSEVEKATGLAVLHIADCTAESIIQNGFGTVGLLGTQFTMEKPFYRQRLEDKFGIKVIVPDLDDRAQVHQIIYDELCKGVINPLSKTTYQSVIAKLKDRGAQAVILGCTEICLLLEGDVCEGLPLFNTTLIHAKQAARYVMAKAHVLEAV
jgi:aspartate racemase